MNSMTAISTLATATKLYPMVGGFERFGITPVGGMPAGVIAWTSGGIELKMSVMTGRSDPGAMLAI